MTASPGLIGARGRASSSSPGPAARWVAPAGLSGEIGGEPRQVGVVAGNEAALAPALSHEPRRGGRGHPGCLGECAAGKGQDVPEGLVHGKDAARDGAATEPRDATLHVDGPGCQTILAVRHPGGCYGVRRQVYAVGAEHPEGEADHLGVDVVTVGYQAADGPRVREGRAG